MALVRLYIILTIYLDDARDKFVLLTIEKIPICEIMR